ncbi:unnamed protein product, partial [Linum tenue]
DLTVWRRKKLPFLYFFSTPSLPETTLHCPALNHQHYIHQDCSSSSSRVRLAEAEMTERTQTEETTVAAAASVRES